MAYLLGCFCCIYYNRVLFRVYCLLVSGLLVVQGIILRTLVLHKQILSKANIINYEFMTQCIFYVWLMAPIAEYNGSLILYRRIIRPKFIQYQPGVDRFLSNARDTGKFIIFY